MSTQTRFTTGVSRTAVVIAQARATEHTRPDRLFDDPLASAFVEVVGWIQVAEAGHQNEDHFVLRTRFFDDYLAASGCAQVVLVAAGLDTRAFRLGWLAGTRLFEIDLPGLISFKEAVLGVQRAKPQCERTTVAVDLRDDYWVDALVDAGFDPATPTAWLVEGLLMYLDQDANDALLSKMSLLSAPGSTLALEHVNQAYVDLPEMKAVHPYLQEVGAAWRSTNEDPLTWLDRHGWDGTVTPQTELAARHDRPVPRLCDPDVVGDARMWLVTATRRG